MRNIFRLALLMVASLCLACEPEYPFNGDNSDSGNSNTPQEPIPVPKPEEPEEPENPEPENPNPEAPTPAEVTATLTYAECADCVAGYTNPNNYTNSYGTWVICAYGGNSDIQLNSGKVAYVGTPKFENDITKVKIDFKKSFSGDKIGRAHV